MSTEGVRRIAAERERQIEKEGWTAEHDDEHKMGDLALAGACYALSWATRETLLLSGQSLRKLLWPWDEQWWKPAANASRDERIHELEKAGALIAAEIDWMLRFFPDKPEHPDD